ncbi:MAG: hypothetical protein Q4E41_01870 [Bacteroidales bacterium]|nr:hypothetical protein [Bacteroidales bacterium]
MDQERGGFWSKSELKKGVSGVSGDLCVSRSKHETANLENKKTPSPQSLSVQICLIRVSFLGVHKPTCPRV